MKHAWCYVLLTVWAGTGCLTLPSAEKDSKPKTSATRTAPKPDKLVEPEVTAEDINEDNAHLKAKALREEMDREANVPVTPGR